MESQTVTNQQNLSTGISRGRDETKEFLVTIAWALVISMLIRTFAFEPFNIPSGSMEPTLHIGDFLFVSKYSYGYSGVGSFYGLIDTQGRIGGDTPKRGDIVVFKWPGDNATDYIKRLIGLPGDTVQMRQGILYINGTPVERDRLAAPIIDKGTQVSSSATDYWEHLPAGPTHIMRKLGEDMPLDNTEVFVVPPRHYFFMGDNRDNSRDSRAPDGKVGFVPEENLVGKAQMLFFSIGDDAHFWEVWKWPWSVRWNRVLHKVS